MELREQMALIDRFICQANALYGEWAKRQGLTYNTLMVLCSLDQPDPRTQKQIAEERMLPKQTVNSIVKELERKGWIQYLDGLERRERPLSLTEAGRAQLHPLLERMYQMEDRVMDRMGLDLCQALLEGQGAFAQALAEEVRNGGD